MASEKLSPESPARLITVIACAFYAMSVVFGRIYCGMHTVTGKNNNLQDEVDVRTYPLCFQIVLVEPL